MKDTAYYEEINRLAGTEKHYFAAANTSAGFVSFFDALFDPKQLKKIYILKGGPGVGKSTLMKNAALAAQKNGFHPIFYHCSSDPKSLDGLLIPETGKAVLDGTAPHTVESALCRCQGGDRAARRGLEHSAFGKRSGTISVR